MGPKRRSTEGASNSSSSLLHKVSRTPGRKGIRIRSQTRQILEHVQASLRRRRHASQPSTGWQSWSVWLRQQDSWENRPWHPQEHVARDGQLLTPVKSYTASWLQINPDTFDKEAMCRLVHAFYIRSAVVKKAREECGFPGGRFCL